MKKTISKTKADLGLLSVTFFWGTTFIVSKIALTEISLLNYLAIRLTLAALAMNLIAFRYRKQLNKKEMALLSVFFCFFHISFKCGVFNTPALLMPDL